MRAQQSEPYKQLPVRSKDRHPRPRTSNAMEVENFLDNVAKELEDEQKRKAKSDTSNHNNDERRARSDRSDRGDRYYGDRDHRDHRENRRHGHGRDRDRSRDRYTTRESNGERQHSRERRRRDGSRPRSSKSKDADTDEDPARYSPRRSSSRDRYRGNRGRDRGDRGGDYYSGGGRGGRSRSPRRDRGDRRDDRYRDRSPVPARRDRDTDDRRDSGRRRTPTPETNDDNNDKRTIFVQQISQRAEKRHLHAFFAAVGPVVEAQIVTDRVTGRSKGVGYVQFKHEDSVPKALELTGQKLKGVPIIAQLTEAEKNRAIRTTGEGGTASATNGAPFHRLYVGNIHFSVTEEDLKEIFLPFGELEQVTLQRDEQNPTRSKGYGFSSIFVDPNDAKKALTEMNGFELAGRQIRVGLGNDKFTPESTAHLLRNFPTQAAAYQGSAFSGAGGRGAYAGGSGGVFDRAHGRDDRGISGASALDDTDMAGVNFKQVDRNKLMLNLARNEVDVPSKKDDRRPTAKARAPIENVIAPSKCIKIQNAFDADQELEKFGANWAKELEVEIKVECDKKYGKVVHIAVDANSDGEVFVKFDSVSGGEKALQGLNGRTFNYQVIRASYVVDKVYNSLYGAAANF
ncbi:hypothetical protein PMIN02_012270 [Paraphaeosphaeria minitans]